MTFGKLGRTYRGETLEQIKSQAPLIIDELDKVMLMPAEARRVELHRLFDSASHNQRVILTEAVIELLVSLGGKK